MEYDELIAQQDAVMQNASEQQNMSIVRDELQRQATYLRTLEATNAKMSAELSALRERHQSVEVLREEKRGLEAKLTVLSELREKVVRLEAELDAARAEREHWASKTAETATPSVALTQSLSDLRLAHARLLEEHGAISALLKQREAEIINFEQRETELQANIQDLESKLRALKEDLRRKESRAMLAEREVGYLEALIVRQLCRHLVLSTHMPAVKLQSGGGIRRRSGSLCRRSQAATCRRARSPPR